MTKIPKDVMKQAGELRRQGHTARQIAEQLQLDVNPDTLRNALTRNGYFYPQDKLRNKVVMSGVSDAAAAASRERIKLWATKLKCRRIRLTEGLV